MGWGLWGPDPFHSALMGHDEKNQLIKELATNVERSEDGLKYTFTIRDDAKFSDGQPLTAEVSSLPTKRRRRRPAPWI